MKWMGMRYYHPHRRPRFCLVLITLTAWNLHFSTTEVLFGCEQNDMKTRPHIFSLYKILSCKEIQEPNTALFPKQYNGHFA